MNNKFIKLNNEKVKYVINLANEYNLNKVQLNKILSHVKKYEDTRKKLKKKIVDINVNDDSKTKELIKNIMFELNNIDNTFKFNIDEGKNFKFDIVKDIQSNQVFYNKLEKIFMKNI